MRLSSTITFIADSGKIINLNFPQGVGQRIENTTRDTEMQRTRPTGVGNRRHRQRGHKTQKFGHGFGGYLRYDSGPSSSSSLHRHSVCTLTDLQRPVTGLLQAAEDGLRCLGALERTGMPLVRGITSEQEQGGPTLRFPLSGILRAGDSMAHPRRKRHPFSAIWMNSCT